MAGVHKRTSAPVRSALIPSRKALLEGVIENIDFFDTRIPTTHEPKHRDGPEDVKEDIRETICDGSHWRNLTELQKTFDHASMSLNNTTNMFPNFLESTASSNNLAAMPRQAPSPSAQHQANQVNGGGMNVGMPMNAGHQMDLNHLYEKVQELSEVLKNNREATRGIIRGAEEVMVSF